MRSRADAINTASSASSWADPTWATILRTPWRFSTICTAVAPEAVFTFRTYATGRGYRLVPQILTPRPADQHQQR